VLATGADGDEGDGVWVAGGGGAGIGGTDLTTFKKLSNLQSNLQTSRVDNASYRCPSFSRHQL